MGRPTGWRIWSEGADDRSIEFILFLPFHKEVGQMVSLAVPYHPVMGGRSYNITLMPFLLLPRTGIQTSPTSLPTPRSRPAAATYGPSVG